MLFRTVYGLELESLYQLIWDFNQGNIFPSKEDIYRFVLPINTYQEKQTAQSVDDAISFLLSSRMIINPQAVKACYDPQSKPFSLILLQQLVQIWQGVIHSSNLLDPLFIQLLDELFILPDNLFIANVHLEANQLKLVQEVGGLSKEKIQAWKRVLEFLGIGQRIQAGFLCTYSTTLLQAILADWSENQGLLQDCLEKQINSYLPTQTKSGEIAKAVAIPLKILEKKGVIEMYPLQDSPAHFFYGDQKLRGISIKE